MPSLPPSTQDNAAIAYGMLLLGAGVVALGFQIFRAFRKPPVGVGAWPARWTDFALWGWLVFCAIYIGQMTVSKFAPVAHPLNPQDPASLLWAFAGSQGLLFPLQLILAFRITSAFSPAPVNAVPLHPVRAVGLGVFSWLAAYPLLLTGGIVTAYVGDAIRHWYPDWNPVIQDSVTALVAAKNPVIFTLFVIFLIVVAPMNEELLFRAGLYRFLKSRFGAKTAAIAAAFLFAIAHWNFFSFLQIFILGLLLIRAYERTGNIAVPMVFHACVNLNTILIALLFPDAIQSMNHLT